VYFHRGSFDSQFQQNSEQLFIILFEKPFDRFPVMSNGDGESPRRSIGAPIRRLGMLQAEYSGRSLPGPPMPLKLPYDKEGMQLYGRDRKKSSKSQQVPDIYTNPANTNTDNQLCHRCQSINFEAIFQPDEIAAAGVTVADLGRLVGETEAEIESNCSLCDFFQSTARLTLLGFPDQSRRLDRDWHIRCYSGLEVIGLQKGRPRKKQAPYKVLALKAGHPTKFLVPVVRRNILSGNVILPVAAENDRAYGADGDGRHGSGRRVSNVLSSSDFGLLRRWVTTCDSDHTACNKSTPLTIPGFKVINCKTREITSLPETENYIALSYVWGPQETPTSGNAPGHNPTTLPNVVAQTIEDAIKVTLELQMQYLWVDRYCIDQYHNENKQQQIDAMADIYENAWATIIALGPNHRSGLPGVSRCRDTQQPHITLQGHTLVSSMPSLQSCLKQSAWSTRAWTMQEGLLSTRCLVFTGFQVFFKCGLGTVCEAFPSPGNVMMRSNALWDEGPMNPKLLAPVQGTSRLSKTVRPVDSEDGEPPFKTLLMEYRRRQMTKEEDAFNAIRGILQKSKQTSYWGVPIFKGYRPWRFDDKVFPGCHDHWIDDGSAECGLAFGLLWASIDLRFSPRSWFDRKTRLNETPTISKTKGRIKDLPTWSWCSTRTHTPIMLFHDDVNSINRQDPNRPPELIYNSNPVRFHASISGYDSENTSIPLENIEFNPQHNPRLRIRGPVTCWRKDPRIKQDHHFFFNVMGIDRGNQAVAFIDPESFGDLTDDTLATDNRFWKTPLPSILLLCVQSYEWISSYWLVFGKKGNNYTRIGIVRASIEHATLARVKSLPIREIDLV
jgi:hypothetical protein